MQPGDRVLVSGSIGEHGTAIMLARGWLELEAEVMSDTRSLWPWPTRCWTRPAPRKSCAACAAPRRRGLGAERARARRGVAILISEADVPVRAEVAGASELLGIDPMYVANEGKLVAIVAPEAATAALAALRRVAGYCEDAADIGEVRTEPHAMVLVDTAFGGRRVMDLAPAIPYRGSAGCTSCRSPSRS